MEGNNSNANVLPTPAVVHGIQHRVVHSYGYVETYPLNIAIPPCLQTPAVYLKLISKESKYN